MTETPDFTITKLAVIDGKVNQIGNRLLAAFELSLHGVRIGGCTLIENADGIVKAAGPIGKTHRGNDIRVRLDDPVLERAVTRKAADAYTALSGCPVSGE